ncbi:unnamed protein product [Parascedosporium putredinis]|uniref:tRNA 2'-phosphotransferase 1 n=1 Tax=Parascedosporium putredinis TaxID=1442378 RepID=A0A9P1GXH9_9PEZI|nr:unnamed protein product [Parascedosporium putredinis]CAI7989263.1 unnamed protein product [Parascedosporium putredinis]
MAWSPLRSLNVTFADIAAAVRDNDKQRGEPDPAAAFSSTDPADWLIRANQGHSIAVAAEGLNQPITLEKGNVPAVAVHGTYFAFWPAILESGGLRPMGRNQVHLATGVPETANPDAPRVLSGMRRDAELLIYVDVERSLRDDAMKWWMSENGVVLTEGDKDGLVPTTYFKEVVGRSRDVGVLFKDGYQLADLPPGTKAGPLVNRV